LGRCARTHEAACLMPAGTSGGSHMRGGRMHGLACTHAWAQSSLAPRRACLGTAGSGTSTCTPSALVGCLEKSAVAACLSWMLCAWHSACGAHAHTSLCMRSARSTSQATLPFFSSRSDDEAFEQDVGTLRRVCGLDLGLEETVPKLTAVLPDGGGLRAGDLVAAKGFQRCALSADAATGV